MVHADYAIEVDGAQVGDVVQLEGDVRSNGQALTAPGAGPASILDTLPRWEPQAPRSPDQLVNSLAGQCRLRRDELAAALMCAASRAAADPAGSS